MITHSGARFGVTQPPPRYTSSGEVAEAADPTVTVLRQLAAALGEGMPTWTTLHHGFGSWRLHLHTAAEVEEWATWWRRHGAAVATWATSPNGAYVRHCRDVCDRGSSVELFWLQEVHRPGPAEGVPLDGLEPVVAAEADDIPPAPQADPYPAKVAFVRGLAADRGIPAAQALAELRERDQASPPLAQRWGLSEADLDRMAVELADGPLTATGRWT